MDGEERVLIVFYSDSGHTAAAARRLAERLPARLECVRAKGLSRGFWGYVKRGIAALRQQETAIEEPAEDPRDYEVVVIATPMWAGRMATPIRAYLRRVADRLDRVAVLVSHGGTTPDKVYEEIAERVGHEPIGRTAISDADRRGGDDRSKVDRLALTIDEVLEAIDESVADNVVAMPKPLDAA
jgi:flavodoxin